MTNRKQNTAQHGHLGIAGELTIYTVLDLKEELLAGLSAAEELELDLSDVGEIDAAGLQLLVMVKQHAAALGKAVRFTGHSPVVVELLDLSGLAGFFGDPLLFVHKPQLGGQST